MELNKTRSRFYLLISFSVMMLLLLGSWWLFLVFKLSNALEGITSQKPQGNLINMIKWEGTTFIVFLIILSITLLYIYFQDHKKTKALQAFFSSLTHELKTPLASIKLQSEVINDLLEDEALEKNTKEKFQKYTKRLIQDSIKLEDQLDNHLQLSRVERGGFLNLRQIPIKSFLSKELKRYESSIHLDLNISDKDDDLTLLADDFALQTIFRNLIDNSLKHAKVENVKACVEIKNNEMIELHYSDNGQEFKGDPSSLSNLFYKHGSPKGSGIGLYLIKNLMRQMKGHIIIDAKENLKVTLYFQREEV